MYAAVVRKQILCIELRASVRIRKIRAWVTQLMTAFYRSP